MKQTINDIEKYKSMMGLPGVITVIKPLYIGGYGIDYKKFVSEGCEIQSPTLSSCTALADVVAIQADGQIIPCCLYEKPAEAFNLGNIFDTSIEQLMLNKDRVLMRDAIRAGTAPTMVCDRSCGNKTVPILLGNSAATIKIESVDF
jgi:radical SAM protein with 4Fe4S-binding SPASM domain